MNESTGGFVSLIESLSKSAGNVLEIVNGNKDRATQQQAVVTQQQTTSRTMLYVVGGVVAVVLLVVVVFMFKRK